VSGIDMGRIEGIVGFLTPLAQDFDARGRVVNVFDNPAAIDRISKGYACGNCCAIFAGFRLDCPLCRQPTHISGARQEASPEIAAYYDNHFNGSEATVPRSPEEWLRDLAADPDVDQVPLSRLGKGSLKRGRKS
jgi:hypothetical protein